MDTARDVISAPKPAIGLLGGIGGGKSRVAAELGARGGRVINADELGHEALRQPEVRARVVQRWGQGLLNEQGEVVRRRLGAIVFADDGERRVLEDLVHPWILGRVQQEIDAARRDPAVRFVVLDAALMLEAGWASLCDRLVFVDTPREQRLQRLLHQRQWTEKEVQAREAAQLPLTEKARRADHVLDNSSTLEHLSRQVDELLQHWGLAPECP
jgi:dephospho-CoA kinase